MGANNRRPKPKYGEYALGDTHKDVQVVAPLATNSVLSIRDRTDNLLTVRSVLSGAVLAICAYLNQLAGRPGRRK
jgi:hypothetical protein